MRRLVGRSILIALLVVTGVFLYYIGKEHSVFFETKAFVVGETQYSVDTTYLITVDKTEEQKTRKNTRKVANVSGPNHKIVIKELLDDGSIGKTYEREFSLKVHENAIISVTAIVNGLDNWIDKTAM